MKIKEKYMGLAKEKYGESGIDQPLLLELLDVFGNRHS